MTAWPGPQPGDPIESIDTPALVLDLDALEHNLARMAELASESGVGLRPHAKAHKCAEIAKRQLALGAVGVCCQKISEAEAMVAAGVDDVLITYPIVGSAKACRLSELARRARVTTVADHHDQVRALGAAASKAGVTITVLVDVYPGGARTGVEPASASAVALARNISGTPGLRFGGLQAYNGAAQHIRNPDARRQNHSVYMGAVQALRDRLLIDGLPCETITGAGTGTYAWEAASGVFTEIQPGSYVFMDADYALNRAEPDTPAIDLRQSLFVLTTVVHAARPGYILVDAGVKAVNVDPAPAWVWNRPELMYAPTGDEQGCVELPAGSRPPSMGEKLLLVPGHCDPTVNLHDTLLAIRRDRLEALWPVTARGLMT